MVACHTTVCSLVGAGPSTSSDPGEGGCSAPGCTPLSSTGRDASPYGTVGAAGPRGRDCDYVLKFLLVGDSDVGKDEILRGLVDAPADLHSLALGTEQTDVGYKSTIILLDGKRVKLQLWDTSGQGRFATILRSYSRGAQGVLLVYDITNRWSFDGIRRWLAEVDQHAPGIPRVLLGNRLHLEFRRAVPRATALAYARKHGLPYFEVSPLANGFHVSESLCQLARVVMRRSGMAWLHPNTTVSTLEDLCYRAIMGRLRVVHDADRLPLPAPLRTRLRSFSDSCGPSGYVLRRETPPRRSGSFLDRRGGGGGQRDWPSDERKSCRLM